MACATAIGEALLFGISVDEGTLSTTRLTMTRQADKKEARNSCGDVVAIVYYNLREEVQIEGYGTAAQAIGATISLTSLTPAYTLYIDEVGHDLSNEDFVKSSIKATGYANVA